MKKAVAMVVSSLLLMLSLALVVGCGGNNGGVAEGSLSEPARLLDNALREAAKGNFQPYMELIQPDVRDAFAQMIEGGMQNVSQDIVEAYYRTEERDADHVVVYYWGTYQTTEGGETKTETIGEAEAQGLPMVKKDGQWYFDFGAQIPQQ